MKNEELTNPVQIVSVVKTGGGYLSILSGNGREITESLSSAIKGLFKNILASDDIKDRGMLIAHIWSDLAFDPLHSLIEDDTIDKDDILLLKRVMTAIIIRMHSYSTEVLEGGFEDDEDSNDSSID